jgi:hypothetical protein
MSESPLTLYAGTAIAQLLVFKSKIPDFFNDWPETSSARGSFGSTGNDFEQLSIATNFLQSKSPQGECTKMSEVPDIFSPLLQFYEIMNPDTVKISNVKVQLLGDNVSNSQQMYDLQTFESQNIFPLPVELYNISPTVPQSFDKINVSQLPEKEIEISLDEKDLTALLTADITDNKNCRFPLLSTFRV